MAETTQNGQPEPEQTLMRETAYLYADEVQALTAAAKRERCSKAEIIRRALRAYLGIGV